MDKVLEEVSGGWVPESKAGELPGNWICRASGWSSLRCAAPGCVHDTFTAAIELTMAAKRLWLPAVLIIHLLELQVFSYSIRYLRPLGRAFFQFLRNGFPIGIRREGKPTQLQICIQELHVFFRWISVVHMVSYIGGFVYKNKRKCFRKTSCSTRFAMMNKSWFWGFTCTWNSVAGRRREFRAI